MRKRSSYGWVIGMTLAAVMALLARQAITRSPLETPVAVTVIQPTRQSIRQTLDLAGVVTYADQRYAVARQSGIATWVTPKGEGDALTRSEALVRLDPTLPCQMLAQTLASPAETLITTLPAEAAAALNQLNTSLPQLEETIRQCTIRAHAAGQVLQTLVHPGEVVQAGSPVALLASTTPQITAAITSGQRQQVTLGAPVHLYQNDEKIAEGSVLSMGGASLDALTGQTTTQLTIAIHHPPALKSGDPIEARVIVQEAENIAAVPIAALDDQGRVWQVVAGRAFCLPGEALIWDAQQVWVQGLTEETHVILSPVGLTDGQRVKEARP